MDKIIMKEPLISVLLCTYNDEKYIYKAVKSILDQTFENFEFIIINDGSTDRTLEILKQFDDKRIILIDKPNTGLTDSLNLGVSKAKSNWIARMDGDDISIKTRFEEQIKYIKEDVAVIGTQCKFIDEEGNQIATVSLPLTHNEILKKGTSFRTMFIHPSVLINKELLLKSGGYDDYLDSAEDLDLWLKLSHYGKLVNIDSVLLKYRKHQNQISITKRKEQLLYATISILKNKNKNYGNFSKKEYFTLRNGIENNYIFKTIVILSQKSIGKTNFSLKFYNFFVLILFFILKNTTVIKKSPNIE